MRYCFQLILFKPIGKERLLQEAISMAALECFQLILFKPIGKDFKEKENVSNIQFCFQLILFKPIGKGNFIWGPLYDGGLPEFPTNPI